MVPAEDQNTSHEGYFIFGACIHRPNRSSGKLTDLSPQACARI
jgi:hypothetical protein